MAANQLTLWLDMGAAANATDVLYIVGPDWPSDRARPPGLAMTFFGGGLWQLAIEGLGDGTAYTYKFRVGYHDAWDTGGGWEAIDGDCTVGQYKDRQVVATSQPQSVFRHVDHAP